MPPRGQRIALAVTANLPSFLDVLRVALGDLVMEHFVLAAETERTSSRQHAEDLDLLSSVPHETIPHTDFRLVVCDARAAIRTGDFMLYSNTVCWSPVSSYV